LPLRIAQNRAIYEKQVDDQNFKLGPLLKYYKPIYKIVEVVSCTAVE